MTLAALADAIEESGHRVLSTDLFDTVLLRDRSTESERFAAACRRAAPHVGVEAAVLTRLRWSFHDCAYRAVAIERPEGEASLAAICAAIATACGLDGDAAEALHRAEVDIDIAHLRPNRPLVTLLKRAARSGMRVIAVSDTYYLAADLRRMLDAVVGPHPIAEVYSSADLGLTKHAGRIFAEVAGREGVAAEHIVHVGDVDQIDVQMARAASWAAVHLPRDGRYRSLKVAGRALSWPTLVRRVR
jgi:FMN phosphatase YigB (HAD superfamily)